MRSITTYVDCLALSEPSQRVFAPSFPLLEGFRKRLQERGGLDFKQIEELQPTVGEGGWGSRMASLRRFVGEEEGGNEMFNYTRLPGRGGVRKS